MITTCHSYGESCPCVRCDMVDINERQEYEKYLAEKSHVLEELCEERGIKLWEE